MRLWKALQSPVTRWRRKRISRASSPRSGSAVPVRSWSSDTAPIEAAALANRDAVCTLNPGLAQGTADRLGGAEVQALVPFPRRVGAASSCRRIPETPPPDPKARVGTADISGRGDGGGSS